MIVVTISHLRADDFWDIWESLVLEYFLDIFPLLQKFCRVFEKLCFHVVFLQLEELWAHASDIGNVKTFSSYIALEEVVITWPSEWKSCDDYQSIASPHPVWLPSWRSVPPHLRHWIGGARFLLIYALRVDGTSTYRSEGYPVATDAYQVWYEIWDYDREQESDDEGLRRWWCMKSGRWSLAFIFDRSIRMGWFP